MQLLKRTGNKHKGLEWRHMGTEAEDQCSVFPLPYRIFSYLSSIANYLQMPRQPSLPPQDCTLFYFHFAPLAYFASHNDGNYLHIYVYLTHGQHRIGVQANAATCKALFSQGSNTPPRQDSCI